MEAVDCEKLGWGALLGHRSAAFSFLALRICTWHGEGPAPYRIAMPQPPAHSNIFFRCFSPFLTIFVDIFEASEIQGTGHESKRTSQSAGAEECNTSA